MFHKSIKGQPFLSFKWKSERPGIVMELRYSMRELWALPTCAIVLKSKHVISFSGNLSSNWVLISLTLSFVVVKMVQSSKKELGMGCIAMLGWMRLIRQSRVFHGIIMA